MLPFTQRTCFLDGDLLPHFGLVTFVVDQVPFASSQVLLVFGVLEVAHNLYRAGVGHRRFYHHPFEKAAAGAFVCYVCPMFFHTVCLASAFIGGHKRTVTQLGVRTGDGALGSGALVWLLPGRGKTARPQRVTLLSEELM